MKIIRRGVILEEELYRATCQKCDTEVEFSRGEASYLGPLAGWLHIYVVCPVCYTAITYALKEVE